MIIRLIGLVLILQGLIACDSEDIEDTVNPSNLMVEVTYPEEGSGLVHVLATADNAVEYQLRMGTSEQPLYSNTTGQFEHTFDQPGTYQLDVRAYGATGRYVKQIVEASIQFEDEPVDLEDGYNTPMYYEGYDLVWNDEFEGTTINPDFWVFEIGTGCPSLCGWGNNELQYYRRENAWVEDGALTIEARQEDYSGSSYTSSRMKTQGKETFKYGRIDVRAVLPQGKGIWPAIWMLGSNITSVGWPRSGEIDIMEMIGGEGRENQVHGTLHWDADGHASTGGSYTLSEGTFGDEYHVFTLIWDESTMQWFVNDTHFHTIDITPDHMTEFHREFFFLFNIAVGGNWPGYPDNTTRFPQQMKIDYIRVFQKN